MSGVVAAVSAVRLERRLPVRGPRRKESGITSRGSASVHNVHVHISLNLPSFLTVQHVARIVSAVAWLTQDCLLKCCCPCCCCGDFLWEISKKVRRRLRRVSVAEVEKFSVALGGTMMTHVQLFL
jgi:hypothetical protein